MRWTTAATLDFCSAAVFVLIGRASHDEGLSLTGLVSTGWPFVIGLAAGWSVSRAWRAPGRVVPTGIVIWPVTVVVGMALRATAGQGTATAFVIVATAFLGATFIGWRALARLVVDRRSPDRYAAT